MRDKKSKKEFSKLMQRQERKSAKNKLKQDIENEKSGAQAVGGEGANEQRAENIVLAKSTKLAFFKQYYTYQAFLEIHSSNETTVEDCFVKTILYIMRWFRNRLGEEVYDKFPDTGFLKEIYPEPENYKAFDIENASNIYGFSFIDFEAIFTNKKSTWLVRLTEPDNGNERSDIYGRTFTTELFVNKLSESVALGIRESCREPDSNSEDASGYRPGFVRDMFFDDDIIITEFGLDKKYAFSKKPVILNGKSGEACEKLFCELINSENRQMPILFVPDDYYKKYNEEVDKKTQSLLGFAHVVVWEGSSAKLFSQVMESEELNEVAGEGQLIFYRKNQKMDYPSDYYEEKTDDLLEDIKIRAQKEPCRKNFDFKEFVFKPSWWDLAATEESDDSKISVEELTNTYEKQVSDLKIQLEDLRTDNDFLQRKNDRLENDNKELDKRQNKLVSDAFRYKEDIADLEKRIEELKEDKRRIEAKMLQDEMTWKNYVNSEQERYLPIINLPSVTKDIKEDIVVWIEKYYSDVIHLHPDAVKSLKDDNRNIDWHRLCMMIHYLSGYTRYRNEGGVAINSGAAREYDTEASGYKVEPCSSGSGSTEIHKDKYTISVNGKDVIMDMHLKYGKGLDANMIRIYFYYDPEQKKSIIGYMPNHLPTRSDSH